MEAEWPMETAARETMEAKLPMEPAAKEPDSPDSENDDRWEFTFSLLRSFILLFLSRPAGGSQQTEKKAHQEVLHILGQILT